MMMICKCGASSAAASGNQLKELKDCGLILVAENVERALRISVGRIVSPRGLVEHDEGWDGPVLLPEPFMQSEVRPIADFTPQKGAPPDGIAIAYDSAGLSGAPSPDGATLRTRPLH
jgi:hypothetical protein